MRLASPAFERRLRKRVRAEIRDNVQLKASGNVRALQKTVPPWMSQAGLSFIFAIFFVSVTGGQGQFGLGYAALALWTTASALRRSRQLQNLLYAAPDLGVLYSLPIADAQVFRLQWHKFLRQGGILFLNLLIAYCGLAAMSNSTEHWWAIGILTAALQWVLIVALSIHCAAWVPYFPLNAISSLLSGLGFVIVFFWSSFPSAVPDIINLGYWSSPSGWINYASVQSSSARDYQSLLLILPVSLIIAGARFSLLRLRENYALHEPDEATHSEPELTEENVHSFLRLPETPGETAIQDRIKSGDFMRSGDWKQVGWIEKIAAKMMNSRQLLVAEFLVGGTPRWTRKLRWGMLIAATCSVFVLFFGEHGGVIIFFPAYLIATALLPMSANEWRGLGTYPTAGLFSPIYAMYPISYDEILAVVLKINVLRCAAASPVLAIYGAVVAGVLHEPVMMGISLATKVAVAAMALQPLFLVLRISAGTNDTKARRLFWHLFWILPLTITLGVCMFIVFTAKNDWIAAGCLVALSVLSFAIVFFQRWLYRQAKFDLLTVRRSDATLN